ncbi:MAG: NfeD family protein [Propionivibrio sp.]|nr:NfeD family protein [Propionivibrio sp.]
MFEWWYWIVLGLCLVMSELVVPAFFVIWFGIGALLVGVSLLVMPMLGMAVQLMLWAGLSTLLVIFWFRYLKPKTVSLAGSSSAQAIGEVGLLVSDLCPDSRGQVRFQKPVLGSDLWECYAETPIKAGERVRVVKIEGHFIKVEAAK